MKTTIYALLAVLFLTSCSLPFFSSNKDNDFTYEDMSLDEEESGSSKINWAK